MAEEPQAASEQAEMPLWQAALIALWVAAVTASFFACPYVRELWLALFQGVLF